MEKKPSMCGEYTLFSVLALVFGIVSWPLGIVFGILALNEFKKYPSLKSKKFAWFGILFGPIVTVLIILIAFIVTIIVYTLR